jgi:hypothetical protein
LVKQQYCDGVGSELFFTPSHKAAPGVEALERWGIRAKWMIEELSLISGVERVGRQARRRRANRH